MLPEPDPHARVISAQLRDLIAAEIARTGPMPFQRYMELALYAPGLGYYAAGSHKFGAQGDFVTAPELGGVFAQTIAQTLVGTLRQMSEPTLMELGAGSGALAVDLLQALAARDALPARYLILERSADLRERQRDHVAAVVPQWLDRVQWLEQPPEHAFDGAIIGNEVVDALACARFVIRADGPCEICVDVLDGEFRLAESAPSPALARAVAHLQSELEEQLPIGYASEVVPELAAWFATISAPLRRGLVLLADYGYGRPEYYRPERTSGSFICHYRHHAHDDPFWHPGLTDLSASVDFTTVAEAGSDSGFELLGYDNQSGYMIGAGIEGLYSHLGTLDERSRLRLTQQIKRLMLPGEMGERFKVMLLGRGVDPEWLPPGLCGPGQRRLL